LIDGTAALISVPTQILLLAFYGEVILKFIKQFKIILLCIFAIGIGFLLFRRFFAKKAAI